MFPADKEYQMATPLAVELGPVQETLLIPLLARAPGSTQAAARRPSSAVAEPGHGDPTTSPAAKKALS